MGVNIKDLVVKQEVRIPELQGKILTVDAFNVLYQFLATIRQRDGSLLTDSHGNVTSHLTGLFMRTTKLMQNGLKLAFVFDGVAPELKKKERERRAKIKEEAHASFQAAEEAGNIEEMKKFASRTSKLTGPMVAEAKDLIRALGLPVIEAPSEGEAQAAHMVKKGDAYASVSQDYDNLLFGVPRMIKNLTISERRKMRSKLSYETVNPEIIELEPVLRKNELTHDQLIAIGMLVGTDFNVGGIPRIGPKNAIKLVRKHGENYDALFEEVAWDEHFPMPYIEVMDLFLNMPTTDEYTLTWNQPNHDLVKEILCERHDFSEARVQGVLDNLSNYKEQQKQKSLFDF